MVEVRGNSWLQFNKTKVVLLVAAVSPAAASKLTFTLTPLQEVQSFCHQQLAHIVKELLLV